MNAKKGARHRRNREVEICPTPPCPFPPGAAVVVAAGLVPAPLQLLVVHAQMLPETEVTPDIPMASAMATVMVTHGGEPVGMAARLVFQLEQSRDAPTKPTVKPTEIKTLINFFIKLYSKSLC